jgi:hypothetical protein
MSSDSQGLPEGNKEKGLEDEKMKLLTKLLSDEISKMILSKFNKPDDTTRKSLLSVQDFECTRSFECGTFDCKSAYT